MAAASAAGMMPCRASMRTCAFEARTSYGSSRPSTESDWE